MTMTILLFIAAACFMTLGHVLKAGRWGLFISVYEEPPGGRLLTALAAGHALNAVLPFRVGDVARVALSGRRLKNGYSLSLATVLADLYLDLVTVSAMLSVLAAWGKGGERLQRVARAYAWILLGVLVLTAAAVALRPLIKRLIRLVAGVFNQAIEFRILYVSYLAIASVKDMALRLDKKRLAALTAGIWACYAASYALFAAVLQGAGLAYAASDVFASLFSGGGIHAVPPREAPAWAAYLLLPLLACALLSALRRDAPGGGEERGRTLPQMTREDRLAFLRSYYGEEDRDRIRAFLEINRDVAIAEDVSAGSNASTLLVVGGGGEMFYRKYAFGEDGDRLAEQAEWIESHRGDVPLPEVLNKNRGPHYMAYDMPCVDGAVSLFRLIHGAEEERAWGCLEGALRDIDWGLHQRNRRPADAGRVAAYLEAKVEGNLRAIRQCRAIRPLEASGEVVVNGAAFPTLGAYGRLLGRDFLGRLFMEDPCADIHGDLTVENIVCVPEAGYGWGDGRRSDYYLIDPNGGNVHESPFLDYAKLLQSLHGNYEFLMMVKDVQVRGNRVSFQMVKSERYAGMYGRYGRFLRERFGGRELLSIYCHEAVHWLRLMPYKIKKDERLAVVFYAGLLAVLRDVGEMAHGYLD